MHRRSQPPSDDAMHQSDADHPSEKPSDDAYASPTYKQATIRAPGHTTWQNPNSTHRHVIEGEKQSPHAKNRPMPLDNRRLPPPAPDEYGYRCPSSE